MALLLLLGYWLGSRIDEWLDLRFPLFTITSLLLFLSMSFYALIKNLPKH